MLVLQLKHIIVIVILVVYVDDIVVIGDDDDKINELKGFLRTDFKIKYLGLLKYFLGIEVNKIKKKKKVFSSHNRSIHSILLKKQENCESNQLILQ